MFLNSYQPPPLLPPLTAESNLHRYTPVESYDLNSFIPVPERVLETEKLRLEPLIPILHVESLSKAFMTASTDPDEVWFYPFPKGSAYNNEVETLMYIEKQRRRISVLSFAAIDKVSGKIAGVLALGCDPLQATLDVKILGIKIFPCYRGSHIFVHACYLLLGYAFDPKESGGLGLVRVGWRTPPENARSQKAAEKLGFSQEGTMRCYEVSSNMKDSLYPNLREVEDGSGRMTEDGVVYSITIHDWMGGKRDRLAKLL